MQVTLNTRVSIELAKALDDYAQTSGKSKAAIVAEAIQNYLKAVSPMNIPGPPGADPGRRRNKQLISPVENIAFEPEREEHEDGSENFPKLFRKHP